LACSLRHSHCLLSCQSQILEVVNLHVESEWINNTSMEKLPEVFASKVIAIS
jgi:hypothetical protein